MNAGSLSDATIKDNTYTHLGVACDCNPVAADPVKCVFFWAKEFIGKEVTHWKP